MADARSARNTSTPLPLQWPLVGRHEQLELFTSTLADERAHGFVIHGAAGVGKTRLADQCLALADAAGRNVARATATEGSRMAPLGALAICFRQGSRTSAAIWSPSWQRSDRSCSARPRTVRSCC